MRMYKGDKLCAACGVSGKERPRRRSDVICGQCRELWQLGVETRRARRAQNGGNKDGE